MDRKRAGEKKRRKTKNLDGTHVLVSSATNLGSMANLCE